MNLFIKEDFISHAGNPLTWKIECDALSDDDWACIAHMIVERETRPFSKVVGIPRGGKKLEKALHPYINEDMYRNSIGVWTSHKILIVDDVWTTGTSFAEFTEIQTIKEDIKFNGWFGWTAFARNPIPDGSIVNALLRMGI
jgi:hypothetical protein